MSYGGSGNYARTPLSNSRHASPEADLEGGFDDKSMLGGTSIQTRLSGQRGSDSGHSNLNTSDQAGFFQTLSALPHQAAPSGTSSDTMSHFPGLASIPGPHYPVDQRSRFPGYLQQQTMIPRSGAYQHHLQNGAISPAYLHRMASGTSMQTPSGSEASGSFHAAALHPGPAHSASNSLLLASVGQDTGHDDDEEDDDEDDQDDDASSADDLHSSFEDEKPSASKTTVPQKRKGGRNTGPASSSKQKRDSKATAAPKKRKQADKDAESKQQGKTDAQADDGDSKSKSTRGSRACTVCRRLKMRCELSNIENDTKCRRCRAGGHECIFEESQRGRRKNQKTDAMAKSIRAMENTLETVLKAIAAGNAHTVAGMTLGPDGNLVPAEQGPETQLPKMSPQSIVGPSFSFPPMPSSDLGTGQPSNGPRGADTFSMVDNRPETHHPSGPSPINLQNHQAIGLPPLPPPRADDLLSQASGQANSPGMRLHSLPEPENTWAPLGLLAEASLENNQLKRRRNTFLANNLPHTPSANEEIEHNKAKAARDPAGRNIQADERPQKLGPANDAYFQPGPFNILPLRQMMIDTQLPSPLLTDKIITVEEAVLLFNLYYRECAMHTAHYLLEDWHTPMNVSSRSTFLFTTICAVASKFYTARPELYGLCMPYARKLASDMIERGFKSVEIVQAYMLLAYYNTPTERFEDDRTWTNIGLAIRMAVELNLWRNPKAPVGLDEEGIENFTMETMNRERTWYQIFIMDRSIAIQTGRPHSLHVTAFERNAKAWGHQRASREADAGAAAIVELYRITSGFQELLQLSCFATPGSASLCDYAVVTKAIDTALENWNSDWTEFSHKRVENGASPTRQQVYSMTMKNFYFHYHRLLAYSYILQQVVRLSGNSLEILPYFLPCYESASQVLKAASEKLHPLGHLRYAQDLVFTNLSYAAVFLLKLLRPELAEFTDADRILAQVEQLVATLDGCSVDEHHIPALYAGFLKVLLAAKRSKDGSKTDDISLDPALADKLTQSQPANAGLSATLAALPTARPAGSPRQSDAMPQIFAQDLGGGAGRPFGQAHSNASAFMSGEPSNQASGGFWNLDQLGQAGFWENLSMPGLGSPPTYGLSAGHLFHGDPWPFSTPNSASASRNVSPKLAATPNVTIPSFEL